MVGAGDGLGRHPTIGSASERSPEHAQGSVFLCRHVLDDLTLGDYAVKKVPVGDNKAWLRDMVREVKTFERLHHPNVVEYKHSWLELSRSSLFCPLVPFLFILMQYCNGGSLDELVFYDGSPWGSSMDRSGLGVEVD